MDDDAGDTRRSAARWRVRLKGEAFDLEELVGSSRPLTSEL